MRIIIDECENGRLVTVNDPITPATIMRMLSESAGGEGGIPEVLEKIQQLMSGADPVKRYVFGTLAQAGQFLIAIADDVDDGQEQPVDLCEADVDVDDRGKDWGMDLDGNPLGDPMLEPLYDKSVGEAEHHATTMPSSEDFDDSYVGKHDTMPLVNGDEIILPAGTKFEVGGRTYTTEEGDRAIFCGLLKKNPETALIQVPLGEGVECVTRVEKHSFTPAEESNHGE